MSTTYIWSNTDSQIAAQGTASPPLEDNFTVPRPVLVEPQQPTAVVLGWAEQGEMPLLQAMDDGGWTPFFTAGNAGLTVPDGSSWANDELPQPMAVTPNEDWDIVRILGLPVPVPPPVRMPEYGWHSEEREAPITAIFPSDDSVLPLMRVIPVPLQSRDVWLYEQSDWWGGGTGTGGDVIQLQTLQTIGGMAIP